MSVVSVALIALVGVLLFGELRWVAAIHSSSTRLSGLHNRLRASRAQLAEFAALEESKAQVALVQGIAEQLIDSTTEATRETHQKIADVPFSVLESIPATRDAAKAARGVHDLTSTGVYATVSLVNKGVGKSLRSLLKAQDRTAEKPKRLKSDDSDSKPDG